MHNFWLCSLLLALHFNHVESCLSDRFVRLLGWHQCAVQHQCTGCGIRDLEQLQLQFYNVGHKLHTGSVERSVWQIWQFSAEFVWKTETSETSSGHQDCGPQGRCPTLVMASATLSQHHPVISAIKMRIRMEVSRNVMKDDTTVKWQYTNKWSCQHHQQEWRLSKTLNIFCSSETLESVPKTLKSISEIHPWFISGGPPWPKENKSQGCLARHADICWAMRVKKCIYSSNQHVGVYALQ